MARSAKSKMRPKRKADATAKATNDHPIGRLNERSDAERRAIEAVTARFSAQRFTPRVRLVQENGTISVSNDYRNPTAGTNLIMEAVGTCDGDFFDAIIAQLLNLGAKNGKANEQSLRRLLAMVKGIVPQNETEAMLATQMASIHDATLTMAQRLAQAKTLPQQDSAGRLLNQLARTYAAQVEALKRYRSGGEQTVRVEHVTVNEGGQAVVGNVSHRGRGESQNGGATS